MESNTGIPRMRTAANIVAEIKALDPATDVTEYWVRGLIRDKVVPIVRAGCKCLVNLDDVLAVLRFGTEQKHSESDVVGGIRRVEV